VASVLRESISLVEDRQFNNQMLPINAE